MKKTAMETAKVCEIRPYSTFSSLVYNIYAMTDFSDDIFVGTCSHLDVFAFVNSLHTMRIGL